jgi:hypothetical protein
LETAVLFFWVMPSSDGSEEIRDRFGSLPLRVVKFSNAVRLSRGQSQALAIHLAEPVKQNITPFMRLISILIIAQ